MTYQLRVYQVRDGAMEQWVTEWRTVVYPLRLKLGFNVVGAWTVDETNQFVWIIGYDGPMSFEEAERAYYESPERVGRDPEPTRHLASTEKHLMASAL